MIQNKAIKVMTKNMINQINERIANNLKIKFLNKNEYLFYFQIKTVFSIT